MGSNTIGAKPSVRFVEYHRLGLLSACVYKSDGKEICS